MKISIKREQNDASISSAEREKFGTKFKTFRLFSMAALALMMAACSNEDNAIEQQPAQARSMHFVATIAAPNSGAATRTTYKEITEGDKAGTINVTWNEGDQIALIHSGEKIGTVKVKTVDSTTGDATIEGNINTTGVTDGDDVTLAYPASGVGDDGQPTAAAQGLQLTQDGTLAYIQNNLDARMGTGKISVPTTGSATLKENVKMASQMAIWKLTLQDNAATPSALNATKLTLTVGTTPVAVATTSSAMSEWYISYPVAALLKENVSGDLTISATVGSATYIYTKTGGISLTAGNYYQSTVTMALAAPAYTMAKDATAADKGKLICTDGHIHANGEDAACTKSRVAKIIYLGTTGDATYSHGLALALEDVSSNTLSWDNSGYDNNSKTAAEWCSAWNTSKTVTGATWLLASKDQWNYMLGASGAGSYTALRDGFSGITGASNFNLTTDVYWSSTESESSKAWGYGFSSGDWYSSLKVMDFKVRACLAF